MGRRKNNPLSAATVGAVALLAGTAVTVAVLATGEEKPKKKRRREALLEGAVGAPAPFVGSGWTGWPRKDFFPTEKTFADILAAGGYVSSASKCATKTTPTRFDPVACKSAVKALQKDYNLIVDYIFEEGVRDLEGQPYSGPTSIGTDGLLGPQTVGALGALFDFGRSASAAGQGDFLAWRTLAKQKLKKTNFVGSGWTGWPHKDRFEDEVEFAYALSEFGYIAYTDRCTYTDKNGVQRFAPVAYECMQAVRKFQQNYNLVRDWLKKDGRPWKQGPKRLAVDGLIGKQTARALHQAYAMSAKFETPWLELVQQAKLFFSPTVEPGGPVS